jgi:hypothetical protein
VVDRGSTSRIPEPDAHLAQGRARPLDARTRRRRWALGVLAASLAGCPSPPRAPTAPVGALAASQPGGVVRLDVRRIEARPGLTLLVRDGDPAPALVVAVATGLEPLATTALGSIVEHRLRAAGFPVEMQIDGLAFRIVWTPVEQDRLAAMLAALVQAFTVPVHAERALSDRVAQRFASLRRHPLDGPALAPIAQCSGMLGIVASTPQLDPSSPEGLAQLERWRSAGLTVERTSLALVGPAALAEAAVAALERTKGWPPTQGGSPAGPDRDQHGVFPSASLQARTALLHLAFWVDDPHRAATAVAQLGQARSPLVTKLAAAPRPWRVETMQATALPAGGCVSLTLRPSEELPADDAGLTRAAAQATALARREIERQLSGPPDPFVATSQIITAGDPREAAARAAWWSLAAPTPGRPVRLATALGVSASERAPTPQRLGALEQAYRAAQVEGAGRPSGGAIGERRLGVERGQGEVWVLVASPCALLREGAAEAGSAALAALSTVLGATPVPGVVLEPWIDPSGVGLLAHGGLKHASELPGELAARVARAAGQAFATGVGELGPVLEAKRQLLSSLDDDRSRAFEQFARAAAPNHPSWLAPLGMLDPVRSADRATAARAWREIQRSPVRIAVIANADLGQAERAAQEVDRWLLDEAGARACEPAAPLGAPRTGEHATPASSEGEHRLLFGALVGPLAEDRRLGELTAVALGGNDGILAEALGADRLASSWSAQLVGGGRAAALLVELSTPAGKAEAATRRMREVLARLRAAGPSAREAQRALGTPGASARNSATRRLDPRIRVSELWTGDPGLRPSEPPTIDRWRAWLQATLPESSLIVLSQPTATRP